MNLKETLPELGQRNRFKHGHAPKGNPSPTWISWKCMKDRCLREKHTEYHNYGSRGIGICDRWVNSFESFLADMGEKPKGMTLERKDNAKGYSPDNCKWATRLDQTRNRRNTAMVEYEGKIIPMSVLSEKFGVKHNTLYSRIHVHKWPVARAIKPGRGGV